MENKKILNELFTLYMYSMKFPVYSILYLIPMVYYIFSVFSCFIFFLGRRFRILMNQLKDRSKKDLVNMFGSNVPWLLHSQIGRMCFYQF